MKKICLLVMANCLLIIGFAQSKYDHRKLFDPQFYPVSSNEFRSANGAPGPKYWQNRADYKINCTLDTGAHKVTGSVEITYTNNSPDDLEFVWLQMDQNIYKENSANSPLLKAFVDKSLMKVLKPSSIHAYLRSLLPTIIGNQLCPNS